MLRLEKISHNNINDILGMKVKDEQKAFVADNSMSIIEAYIAIAANGHAFPFGIYDGDVPVGFLMIGYGTDDDWQDPPEIAKSNYNLWRLMIDSQHQGKGYGKQSLRLAADFIKTYPCGKAKYCWLSYSPQNAAAQKLYSSFGFVQIGLFDNGEQIAVLEL